MGRILPFYRTGGVVSGGGGGGGPLGDATVWPQIADWSAFGTIPGPLRVGDRVFVSDLSPGFGYAQYDGAAWRLVQGFFATVADLLAFGGGGELIYTTGEALVGTGDETSVVYYYTGAAWDRMPDGSLFIYPSVPDWASLPTADTVVNNDEVGVDDLGYTGSSGVAQWHAATPEWRLIEGQFTSVADMLAFDALYPVHNLATARVRSTAPFNDRSIVYIHHSGVWTRSGVTTTEGYAWDITDLTNIDPSGIGATQIGDFARYTDPTTSEVAVYRLRSVPAVGSINLTVWVPASIYDEAGLTIRGYLIGTETMPASGGTIQGYTVTTSGASASVTTSGGEVVMTSTTINHFANIKSTYALTESDQYYVRMNLRLSQTAATAMTFYNLLYDNGTTKPQFITTQNPIVELGKYIPSTTTPTLVGSTLMIRGSGTAIGNTAELVEILADGTAANLVNVTRNARPYFSMRRNAQTGTATGQHLLQTFQNATGAQTVRFSYLYFMTY
jgi:hypothetical protein